MKFYTSSCVVRALDLVWRDNMLRNFLQSLNTLLIQIPLLSFRTAKLVGLKHIGNSYPYLLEVKFQNGMCLKYVLLVQDSKHLVVELRGQDPSLISFNSPLILLRERQEESLLPSNVTILFARSRRLSLSEALDALRLFLCPISRTNECEMLRAVLGGNKTLNEPWQIIQLPIKRSQKLEFSWKNGSLSISPKVVKEASSIEKRQRKLLQN